MPSTTTKPARKPGPVSCRASKRGRPPTGWCSTRGPWPGRRIAGEIASLEATERQAGAILESSVRRSSAARPAGLGAAADRQAPHAIVVTVSEVAYTAVRARLAGPIAEREVRGTLYETGSLAAADGDWQVVLVQADPGGTPAGLAADRAIGDFAPQVVLFVGLADGRDDVSLGDVVAASAIYDYEAGEAGHGSFLPRFKTHRPTYRMVQRACQVARLGRWVQLIGPGGARTPRAFVTPAATESAVVADDRSERARRISRYAGDARAVDLAGHGFLAGAYVNPDVDALVVQGICSMLGDAGDDRGRAAAGLHAAAFTAELLRTLPFRG